MEKIGHMKTAVNKQEYRCEATPAAMAETSYIDYNEKRLFLLAKRIFDIVFSIVGLAVCAVPMLIIGVLVRLDSEGPAIYAQERLGLNGKPFMIYKFRSMRVDAEAGGPQWAKKNDERCTRLGLFLRKTRLDEIPQLFNILKGEMSLVGPRPERAYFYDVFDAYIPGFRNRLMIKPGLTGLAQVNGGYDLNPQQKLIYDMEYIRTQSILLDLNCILRTAVLVFTHKGAR